MTTTYASSEGAEAAVSSMLALLSTLVDRDVVMTSAFFRELIAGYGPALRTASERGGSAALMEMWARNLPEQLEQLIADRAPRSRRPILDREDAYLLLRLCPPPPLF